jgi:LuxR family maltose regulon positive regulatory protein
MASTGQQHQAQPVLTTKLYVPQPRAGSLRRERLLQRLDEGLAPCGGRGAHRLALISAPAGYGKTTLLAEWIAQADLSVAWLSLDEGDNDPTRFATYLGAALETLPGFSISCPAEAPSPSGAGYLTALLNQASELSQPAALVLDDLHRIDAAADYEIIATMIEHLPPTLHLIIGTRADPPLPIARLRAAGELTEIRQADLRFTREEAASFLRDAMGLDLSEDQVTALAERTEGWIAGLQMAAASLRRHDDVDALIRTFAGSHRYVMDYLVDEVLEGQPAEVQTFLLRTSILRRLSAPLCRAVLGEHGSGDTRAILAYLDAANLFITPLDDRRVWYRYHGLFADLLRRQLTDTAPALITDLHGRASRWYEEQGLLPESIDHSLAAAAFERAAALIERVAEPLMARSEFTTLRTWLDQLPTRVLDQHPRLRAYHAWLLLVAGEPLHTVEARLAPPPGSSEAEAGEIKAARALITISRGELEGVRELAGAALASLTADDGLWFGIARWLRDVLDVPEDGPPLEDASAHRALIDTYRGGPNALLTVMGFCSLGELRVKEGQLREAERLFRRALDHATDARGEHLPVAGQPLSWLGELARERNELAAAESRLVEALQLIERWGSVAGIEANVALARVRHARADRDGARRALAEAERLAVMFDATYVDDLLVAMHTARIDALEGDFAAVEDWITSRGLDDLDPDDLQLDATVELHLRKYELVVLGLIRILDGQPGAALRFLRPLLTWAASRGRWGIGIETLALLAAGHHMLGSSDKALERLSEAFARAQPEGYVRAFVDIGEPMAQLLYRAVEKGICADYAGRLLASFPTATTGEARARGGGDLVEPLSEREVEVLTAIARGLTNQEAAQQLYISERTVKWHASNIYGKLGVSNRTEAVARARTLGILPR